MIDSDKTNTKLAVIESDGNSIKNNVVEYLGQIFNATEQLIQVGEQDDAIMELESDAKSVIIDQEPPNTPNQYINGISNNLVKACNPILFGCGTSNLPTINTFKFHESFEIESNLVEDSDFIYTHRRSDYLRRLLRALGPISMEVTAKICSTVISTRRGSSSPSDGKEQDLESVILFSHWLPVAPHLTPMVTEMFNSIENPWRNLVSENVDIDKKFSEKMFLAAEASHKLCSFFASRGEVSILRALTWDWTFVFAITHEAGDTIMHDAAFEGPNPTGNETSSFLPTAFKWFSVRILSLLMGWNSSVTNAVLKIQDVEDNRVPWQMHPWELDQEEVEMEKAYFERRCFLWNDSINFKLPSSEDVQAQLQSSPYLALVGDGIAMYKQGTLRKRKETIGDNLNSGDDHNDIGTNQFGSSIKTGYLVPTATTNRNLALLAAAMCQDPHPQPVLVCGPHGSGKSSIIRELLRLCRPKESLVEFHIDEETDSKTLIGSYTTTDIPGEFSWRAGALTNASREGRWILIEDLDQVPVEIQAALVKLFEERMIPLGNGKFERSHQNFRIFATCTTTESSTSMKGQERHSLRIGNHRGGGRHILNPTYWRNVHVKPMTYSEVKEVATSLYSNVPISVVDSAMTLLKVLDSSGRHCRLDPAEDDKEDEVEEKTTGMQNSWVGARIPSVRDLFKLLSRISNGICFEQDTLYTTEAQRTLCMAESADIFIGSCPQQQVKDEFIGSLAAPIWGITKSLALNYMRSRKPSVLVAADFFEIGRAKFQTIKSVGFSQESPTTFAETSHALRLMESIAVCVRENEPILLVGETGCGKTTNIQQLATRCERTLIVQNLSLQTDSTDLLGGYRPLEIQNVARNLYKDFVDSFVSSFSRKQNIKFLQYASSMLEKSNWKKLSQCFKRAAQLGLKKMNEQLENQGTSNLESMIETWQTFAKKADRFERQRLSCDAGLAFEFAEGALVDAIQTGKW
jgi:MoxR-like ATPase